MSEAPSDLGQEVGWPTKSAQERIWAALRAQEILEYDDVPCAISSHIMEYRVFAVGATTEQGCGALIDFAVEAMSRVKQFGATHIAWRKRPRCEKGEGGWYFSARFHLLPREADTAFWAAHAPKPEGASVPELV